MNGFRKIGSKEVLGYIKTALSTIDENITVEYDYDDTCGYVMVYANDYLLGFLPLDSEFFEVGELNYFIYKIRYAILDYRDLIMDELDFPLDL